jgi:hypothetical protein
MSAAESRPIDRAASLPKPSHEPDKRIYLRDLPTPTELGPEIERYVRRYGGWFRRAKCRRWAENHFKFRWYFGGHCVAYLHAPDGIAILMLDYPHEEGIHRKIRNSLPENEREQLRCEYVSRLFDEEPRLPSSWQGL